MGFFIEIRTKETKEFHPQKNMFLMSLCLNKLSLCQYGRTQWNCNETSPKLLTLGIALPLPVLIYIRQRAIDSTHWSIARAYVLRNKVACIVPYQAFISTSSFMSSSLRSRSKKRYSSMASDWSGMILKRNEYLVFHFHLRDINPPLSI